MPALLKQPLKTYPKLLEGFDILLRENKDIITVKQISHKVKAQYPDLYQSKLFQEWMKKK